MYLGEIVIPEKEANWVPLVRYVPRPPIQIRGGLDPYGQERKREVYLAEEAAWKQITLLQAESRRLDQRANELMSLYNEKLQFLENRTGKKTGLMPMAGGYSGIALNLIPIYRWYTMAAMVVNLVSNLIGGNKKKKEIQKIIRELEDIQNELRSIAARVESIQAKVTELVAGPLRIIEHQKVKIAADLTKGKAAYAAQQVSQREAGKSAANLAILYERLHPARQVRDVPL